MRILLTADPIIPVPPTGYGGIERIVAGLALELMRRGHVVGLVAKEGSTLPASERFSWPGHRVSDRADTFKNTVFLSEVADRFQPDVIHSFSRLAYLTTVLRGSVPIIMSYQRHTGGPFLRIARWIARSEGLTFTGCSNFVCKQGREAGGSWIAIPNFIDPDVIPATTDVPADAPLLFLSRVESIKGPDLAIEMARKAGRRLIIAGNRAREGEEARFFHDKVAPHIDGDRVKYVGEVDDARKFKLLAEAAALVVPVRWDEPFGIVFIEALATGTPVISSARGALPEIIVPGLTGFLVEGADAGAHAISELGTLSRAACRDDVEHRFAIGPVTAQYEALYRVRISSRE